MTPEDIVRNVPDHDPPPYIDAMTWIVAAVVACLMLVSGAVGFFIGLALRG